MEKWKNGIVRFLVLSSVTLSCSAFAQSYKAKICYNCDQIKAKEIALSVEFEPKITCYADDHLSYDYEQSCYSKNQKVLVTNAQTSQTWGFNVYHDNQGKSRLELSLKASPISVPEKVKVMINGVLSTYDRFDKFTTKMNNVLAQTAIFDEKRHTATCSNKPSNCSENSATSRAVNAAFNVRAISALQLKLQTEYAKDYASPQEAFERSRFNSINFSVGAGSIGIGGSWEFVTYNNLILVDFTGDVPSAPVNKVGYTLSAVDNVVAIKVNDAATTINGISLNHLKGSYLKNADPCLIEKLNEYLEASVKSYGGSGSSPLPGSGTGLDSNETVNLSPGYGRIPRNSDRYTCTWRFYKDNEESFRMQGPCP